MPSATVPGFSTILDRYGNPMRSGPSGTMWKRTERDDKLRPAPRNHYGDYIDLVASRDSKRLISEGRAVGSRGPAAALFEQKADYVAASDFRPTFLGTDADYGTTALPLLEDALKISNLRGWLYDWKTTWRLTIPAMATSGRVYVLLTTWPDTDYPALQILEAHRIGQRDDSLEKVSKDDAYTTTPDGKRIRGAYRDLRIKNGIIYNISGTEVAYRVLGPDPEGTTDQDISARDLFPVARPRSFSEGTTPPEIAAALFDFIGLELAQSAALTSQIVDGKLTVVETNETGAADPVAVAAGMTPANPNLDGSATQMIDEGEWRHVKSGKGKLEPWQSNRPSNEWQTFDQRVHSRAAAGIRWRSEMLDPAALKAASNRALQDQINTLIRESFSTVAKGATRALGYISAKLTGAPLNILPLHAESRAWGIATPPWFEVDRASAKYDLDDVAAGRISMETLHHRDGTTSVEVMASRAKVYLQAKAISAKTGVPLEIVLGDMGATVQRTGAPEQATGDRRPETGSTQASASDPKALLMRALATRLEASA
jgi:hypothetical protein